MEDARYPLPSSLNGTITVLQDRSFKRLTSRVYNNSFEESFDNAWTVIQDILEKTGCDTEEAILKLFDNKKNLYPLHKLNEKLNTESTKEKLILIGVDNIEHMGTESWLFLQELLFSKIAIIIATVTEEYRPSIHFVKYIIQQVHKSINMRPLDEEELGLLACTVLNVQAINKAFLPFFFRYSGGNALRMEEILMIPPLQKHFCLLPASGIPKRRLQTEFLSHPDLKKDPSVSLVCDILDLDELETLQIPSHLLDVVRDHTTGLSPEEQMLIRKCALLGDNFGIYVLEAVCPEYPTVELRCKIRTLIRKNLLRLHCQHLEIVTKDNREMISLKEIPMDFCIHPIKFYCEYLRKSVLSVMAESQRERLNLYLADLLLIPPRCDSCKQEWERRRSFVYPILSRNFRIPCIDMRTCQCLNLKTHFALQVEYQLDKGNGLLKDRIAILVDASEYGIFTNSPKLVDKILSKATRLIQKKGDNDKSTPDPASIAIHRLRAQELIDQLANSPDDVDIVLIVPFCNIPSYLVFFFCI
ncbi:uncharacterized protein TNIN_15871 [Trichonephila inaurata madagascariensis]|uniref:Uncharacterized protein n=1 Tax=Trichonephila inaurata madagascariensis TaxID=2747483 RepID=A0A8X6XGI6_9ARAC|nr:uncharacterized protein TNIN_15871 [Trichonephila inaurata madagascariensis]